MLLDNSVNPRVSVAAIAKKNLPAGSRIPRGIGSFLVRGEAVFLADRPDHVPIGLLEDVEVKSSVPAGKVLTWGDVDLPDSLALKAWRGIMNSCDPRGEEVGLKRVVELA